MSDDIKIPVDQVHAIDVFGRAGVRIAEIQAQLNAANQRIAGLEISNCDGQRLINELNWQLADSERKLATAREAMRVSYALLDSQSRNADRIEETLRQAEKEIQALAQIEQQEQPDATQRNELVALIGRANSVGNSHVDGMIADAILAAGYRKDTLRTRSEPHA